MKNPHAVALGRKGGLKRTANLTKKELAEIGRKGGLALWRKLRASQKPTTAA